MLYDSLISIGEVKEISYQKVDNDSFCFLVGMKRDEVASSIIEHHLLKHLCDSFIRGGMKPCVEPSFSFELYLNSMKEKKGFQNHKERTITSQMEIETQ